VSERRLGYCKLCELEDFSDPELRELIRDVYASDREHFGDPDFPAGREYRKYWEVAMTARALREFGALRDGAEVLGVGAGHEATIYWLTRHTGRVVATDLYDQEDSWSESDSGSEMLRDPGRYWDGPWNPERLEVRSMSGLELAFEDESFDAIFSSSSIEHFGGWTDVRRSIEEMYRVLRPGGIAALSTEFRLEGRRMGMTGALMFNEAELRAMLLDGLWWDPATPLDIRISEETLAQPVLFGEALEDSRKGLRGWSQYPHIVLREGALLWTSVHVALIKSASTAAAWREQARPVRPPNQTRMPRPTVRQLGRWAGSVITRWRGRRSPHKGD
jgi:SAM-dependent methyltransferase